MTDVVFVSKVDAWMVVALLMALLLIAVVGYVLVKQRAQLAWPIFVIYAAVTILVVSLSLWSFIGTYYEFKGTTLLIHPGGRSIDIASISSVKPTRNGRSSPALSLDRLEINYGVDQTVLISPQTKEAFLGELQRRQDALRSGELRGPDNLN